MKKLPLSRTPFTSSLYPKFIREHIYLKTNPKIQKIFPLIGLPKMETKMIKGKKVVFSSDPWDIATMSMRGVNSCQKWVMRDSYWYRYDIVHCKRLIGSIIDPCCAIIYVSDGTKTEYGEKMLSRMVVRFIINRETGKGTLFADTLYGIQENNKSIFNFLSTHRGSHHLDFNPGGRHEFGISELTKKYFIPANATLNKVSPPYRSYRDVKIPYSPVGKVIKAPKKVKELFIGKNKFIEPKKTKKKQ
jgi:hypothetical protein